jgi:hypothetical protein
VIRSASASRGGRRERRAEPWPSVGGAPDIGRRADFIRGALTAAMTTRVPHRAPAPRKTHMTRLQGGAWEAMQRTIPPDGYHTP